MSFVVVGDATLDVTVAPSRPPRAGGDVPAIIRLGPGGQGANVAVRLARRGAPVLLVAPVAHDAVGRLIREALTADHVAVAPLPASRTAAVVALLDPDGERTMLSDRQALHASDAAEHVGAGEWIHVSAYALLDHQEGDQLAAAIGGRAPGVRLSLAGGSIPPEPATVARFRARLERAMPDLLVLSRDEAAALLGGIARPARKAAAGLAGMAAVVIVTAGEQGSAATMGGEVHEVAPPNLLGPVLDATGAGDAYLAALVQQLGEAGWPPEAPLLRAAMEIGSRAGALTARAVGAQARVEGERPPGGVA